MFRVYHQRPQESTVEEIVGMGRHWLFRLSIAANAFVLFYFAIYSSSQKTFTKNSEKKQNGPIHILNNLPGEFAPFQQKESSDSVEESDAEKDGGIPHVVGDIPDLLSSSSSPPVKFSYPCDEVRPLSRFGQRGPFWVLYNYIQPRRVFGCGDSITYTTHADFTFLDNLIPLLERWNGPVSLSLYSPGTDFKETVDRILYLRECTTQSSLVKDFVSFHLFFDYKHTPKTKIQKDPGSLEVNCSTLRLPFGENIPTYKKSKKLPYPVNVARNVAREMSSTYFILPSDIELFPNPHLIPQFMDMIRRNNSIHLQRPNPHKVWVLPIFEVEESVGLPQDKKELIGMLRNKTAIPFHKYVCANCHRIPMAKEWMSTLPVNPNQLSVFHVGKRKKPFHHWEPIYIGTKTDPEYDERLTWEGRSDKMTQGYVLCVLDYEFQILDNAFLVHKPGIKKTMTIPSKTPVVSRQNTVISNIILPELRQLYGSRPGCVV